MQCAVLVVPSGAALQLEEKGREGTGSCCYCCCAAVRGTYHHLIHRWLTIDAEPRGTFFFLSRSRHAVHRVGNRSEEALLVFSLALPLLIDMIYARMHMYCSTHLNKCKKKREKKLEDSFLMFLFYFIFNVDKV
jgi:hypothetical protein